MDNIKVIAKLNKIMFPKGVDSTSGGFAITSFEVVEMKTDDYQIKYNYGDAFSVKGEMPSLKVGTEYEMTLKEGETHPQFGTSYEIKFMRQNVDLDVTDRKSIENFLKVIMTERQAKAFFEAYDNPIEILESGDIDKLLAVKGVGDATANRMIDLYNSQRDYSEAYMELGEYGLTPNTIMKAVNHFNSPEVAIAKIKENPYCLKAIDGYSFKKCDEIFMTIIGEENSELRITEFLYFLLETEAMDKGNTWITPRDLMNNVLNFIPRVDKSKVGKVIKHNKDFLVDDKTRISLRRIHELEESVADNIVRLMKAKPLVNIPNYDDIIVKAEISQGWEFTDEQIEAIDMMMTNNVSVLQGFGGTGKSSVMKVVSDIIEENNYLYAQMALSGKASSNLSLVTEKEGSTIHRLLSFQDGGFFYHENNKLPHDVEVVDEVSMVDQGMSYSLISAMRDGAKLIMLGDSEQLESIGIPFMIPLIESGVVPSKTLTIIHRQAQKSAVITDSIKIRQGKQIIKESVGRFIHGELEDLEYVLVKGDDEILVNTMKEFKKYVDKGVDIGDIQILTQTRNKGEINCLKINKACQQIYNPVISDNDKQINLGSNEFKYSLRIGDRVINMKNNYKAQSLDGIITPVFNGSTGIILDIAIDEEDKEYILIEFDGIGIVKFSDGNYRSIELGYCITTHKSQGSSSKIIIIAFPYHFMLNTRQLLYTAITRTREHCVIISTKRSITSAISKDDVNNKRTFLSEMIRQKY